MSYLIDEVARSLATSLPRRRALNLIGRLLVGGLFGTAGLQRALAQPKGTCGGQNCSGGQKCCTTASPNFCAQQNQVCCGTTSCQQNRVCCNGVCCNAGQTCMGSGLCSASTK